MTELPLSGVRILALEQMAALPYATQLMGWLGADVVKVEHPAGGESGRGATPSVPDPQGRSMGATFLRNNLGKRSVAIDTRQEAGRELVRRLAGRFDVFAENFKPGAADRMGLGWDDLHDRWPRLVYASLSGFGHSEGPYRTNPAYASVVEAMSGIYEFKRTAETRPLANPVGALGDISSGLFTVIGLLAALRQRDASGVGQRVDVAMYDSTVAMTDIVMNFFSLGVPNEAAGGVGIIDTFEADDGFFVLQVVREHHFEVLAEVVGCPEWLRDERLAQRSGWHRHTNDVIRPGVEAWARGKSKREAAAILAGAGLAAGPSHTSADLVADDHLRGRGMVTEMSIGDTAEPVLVPGNPVHLSGSDVSSRGRVPWLGEHTDEVLAAELGLSATELAGLRDEGVVA